MLGARDVGIGLLGDAEVGQPKAAIGTDHDVVRLHVAMHDALRVHRRQRAGHLQQDRHRDLRAQMPGDQFAQIAAGEILHRDIGIGIGEPLVIDARHIRMVDLRHQREFLDEALHHLVAFFIVVRGDRQQLEHVLRLGFEFVRQEHLRHAAFAQLADHAVTIDGDVGVIERRLGPRRRTDDRRRCIGRTAMRDHRRIGAHRIDDHLVELHVGARSRRQAGDLDDVDHAGAPLDGELPAAPGNEAPTRCLDRGATGDNAPAEFLGLALEARREVDRVADHGGLGGLAGTHAADRNIAGMHADADGEFRHLPARKLVADPRLEAMRGQHHQDPRLERPLGMIIAARAAVEHRHQPVA